MMWQTVHCKFDVSDTVNTIWRAYKRHGYVGVTSSWSDDPVGPAEQQEKKKLEIIVEEVLKEIDEKFYRVLRAESATISNVVANAAFDDVSLEMLERATDLLARAALQKAEKEKLIGGLLNVTASIIKEADQ